MDQRPEVHLNYPAPAHSAEYQSVFPDTVLFDQPHSQFVIDEQALNKQVRTANPAAHVVFLQQCEEMLQGLSKVEDTTAAVRRLLIQDPGDFPDIGQVADKLHQSERTLSRRLNAESTSFRAVCDEVRNVLAKQYLSNTELTVAEVAHLLGYTETVNFRRAFVRWNGVTPREFSNRSLN
jgi:AraC-like DNA-binding protein